MKKEKERKRRKPLEKERKNLFFGLLFGVFMAAIVAASFTQLEIPSAQAEENSGIEIERLSGGDPEMQAATLKILAEHSDPATLPLLTALHEGSLYRWRTPEGVRVVLVQMTESPDGDKRGVLVDPLTGCRAMYSPRSSSARNWTQISNPTRARSRLGSSSFLTQSSA